MTPSTGAGRIRQPTGDPARTLLLRAGSSTLAAPEGLVRRGPAEKAAVRITTTAPSELN